MVTSELYFTNYTITLYNIQQILTKTIIFRVFDDLLTNSDVSEYPSNDSILDPDEMNLFDRLSAKFKTRSDTINSVKYTIFP